jgi:hypothetical protein
MPPSSTLTNPGCEGKLHPEDAASGESGSPVAQIGRAIDRSQ